MDEKKIAINNPVTVAGVTLIPIVTTSYYYWQDNRGISFMGVKQPVSVIVVSPSVKRAFRMTGEEVSLDQLVEEVPGVKEILARI